MQGVEEKVRFCIQCGQQIGNSKFCPYCGTPVEQKVEEVGSSAKVTADQTIEETAPPVCPPTEPSIEAPESQAKKSKKRKALKITLCCLAAFVLLATLTVLVLYQEFWPKAFTDRQLQEIQSNAEERIDTVLDMLGYENDVESKVIIESSVDTAACPNNEHMICLNRYYSIDFDLTSSGRLADADKAAIVVCMEYLFGSTLDNSEVFSDDPFSSSEDLSAGWDIHTSPLLSTLLPPNNVIMDVTIPITEYNWLAYSRFYIDDAHWDVNRDSVFQEDGPSYSASDVFAYALWRVGGSQKNENVQQDNTGSAIIPTEQPTTPSASPSSEVPISSGRTLPYVIRATGEMPIYSGPGVNYDYVSSLSPSTYTIVEESGGQGAALWGKLKSGAGWIALDHVQLRDSGDDVLETTTNDPSISSPSSSSASIDTFTFEPTPSFSSTPSPSLSTPEPTPAQPTVETIQPEQNQTGYDEDVSFSQLWKNSSYTQKMWPGCTMSKVSEDDCTPASDRKAITPYDFTHLGQGSDFVRFEVLEKWSGNRTGRLVFSCSSKEWTEDTAKELYGELISMLRQTSANGFKDDNDTLMNDFANAYSRWASDTQFSLEIVVTYQPGKAAGLYFYFNGHG